MTGVDLFFINLAWHKFRYLVGVLFFFCSMRKTFVLDSRGLRARWQLAIQTSFTGKL